MTLPPELTRDLRSARRDAGARERLAARVRLDQIATISLGSARELIAHEAGQRRQVVTANVEGRDVGGFVADARAAVASRVKLPAGTYLSWAGAAEGQAAASRQLAGHVAVGRGHRDGRVCWCSRSAASARRC